MATHYRLVTARQGRDGKTYWTKIGVMFPMKDRDGFNISLEALPLMSQNDQGEMECRVVAFDGTDDQQSGQSNHNRAKANGYQQQPLDADLDDEVPF